MKEVLLLVGAGQIGMAIARRMGFGKKIIVGDKRPENAQAITAILANAGFDAEAHKCDLSNRESIKALISVAQEHGPITMLVNAAGVSPSQAPIEAILKVDLYGTAVLLEEAMVVSEMGARLSPKAAWVLPFPASRASAWRSLPPKKMLSLPAPLPKNC